jgi:hypothetical protein
MFGKSQLIGPTPEESLITLDLKGSLAEWIKEDETNEDEATLKTVRSNN